MDFTVIICTYNRSNNLPKCIAALEQQENTNQLNWEVLIVDNNSSDATETIVKDLINNSKIKIRYAFEQKQGLNHARNLGMQNALGKYFAYLDDDITAAPQWLSSIYKSLAENDADASGGRIHLDPAIVLPNWIKLNPSMYGFLGYQDYGDQPMRVDGIKQYPFGGNMAFNRRVIEKVGFFNTQLGRKGEGFKKNELFKGAETDYFHRLAANRESKIFYTPDAIVYHHILPHQLTKKYFLTIHYNAGYQKALHDDTIYKRTLLGIPLFILPQTLRAIFNYFKIVFLKGFDSAFRQRMTVTHFFGTISGFLHKK